MPRSFHAAGWFKVLGLLSSVPPTGQGSASGKLGIALQVVRRPSPRADLVAPSPGRSRDFGPVSPLPRGSFPLPSPYPRRLVSSFRKDYLTGPHTPGLGLPLRVL